MPGNLNTIPLSVIASWPKPNFVDPETRSWMPEFAGVLQAVSTLMVLTRVWLRATKQAGALGLDDLILIPAWLASIAFTVFSILSATQWGADRHIWDCKPSWFVGLAEGAWASEVIFLLATGCTKISILLFYRRLTEGTYSKVWKTATIVAVYFTVLYTVTFVFVLCFNCTPLESYWLSYDPTYDVPYTCVDTTIINPLSGVISVVSDFYSVLLPCLMLRHFDCPKRQKIALNIIFSLGLIVVAAGSVRTYYLTKVSHSYDITWIAFDTFVWSNMEIQLSIICASAPALRVFVRTYLSDPITRAITSARTGSAMRSAQHNTHGSVDYKTSRGTSSEAFTKDAKPELQSNLTTVEEHEIDVEAGSSSSAEPTQTYVIKTPADFESYALQNLERNRPPTRGISIQGTTTRPTFLRSPSEETIEMFPPTEEWHAR